MRPPLLALAILVALVAAPAGAAPPYPATFSIVGADPANGEVGVAVASRFFAVGTVVAHARADVGAVATQSFANTSFGPRGLDLLEAGLTPEEVLDVLLRGDEGREQRQVGIISASGAADTFTGTGCLDWAGGSAETLRAAQGNILTGSNVVDAMTAAFDAAEGEPLAVRLFAALEAGDRAGGDSRGKQSAALLVVREGAGYGGYTDRAIDIRVDDATEPIQELGRLLELALVNDLWNRGWTAFTEERFADALTWQERTAERAATATPDMLPEVLYDLAVIRLANEDTAGALDALRRAVAGNPKLKDAAVTDPDLEGLGEALDEFR